MGPSWGKGGLGSEAAKPPLKFGRLQSVAIDGLSSGRSSVRPLPPLMGAGVRPQRVAASGIALRLANILDGYVGQRLRQVHYTRRHCLMIRLLRSIARRTLGLGLGLLLSLLLAFALAADGWDKSAFAEPDGIADHVVISEVQTAGGTANDEFIELYNPTGSPIDISSWSIQYRGGGATTYSKKNFESGNSIPAHGFFLIAHADYDGSVTPDMSHSTFRLSATGGTVFLVNDQTKLTEDTDGGPTVVDKVAYGTGDYLRPEGTAFTPAPLASKSIERKAQSTSTKETMQTGDDASRGNGYDSDNNGQDFVLRDTPNPQNSSSPTEIPFGPPTAVTLTADPISIPADGISTATITATVQDAGGYVADGTVVTFATDLGILGSKTTAKTTTSGVATATLTSVITPGIATVKAQSDAKSDATAVFFSPPAPVENFKTEETSGGDYCVDAKPQADTVVCKSGPGTPVITVAKYTSNPGGVPSFSSIGKYIDVHIDSTSGVAEVEIRLYYSADEIKELVEEDLRLYWWNGTTWVQCSDSSASIAEDYIWAKIRTGTTPNLNQLMGTPFGAGSPPVPVGGVIVPVSKLELLAPWIGLAVVVSAIAVTLLIGGVRRASGIR